MASVCPMTRGTSSLALLPSSSPLPRQPARALSASLAHPSCRPQSSSLQASLASQPPALSTSNPRTLAFPLCCSSPSKGPNGPSHSAHFTSRRQVGPARARQQARPALSVCAAAQTEPSASGQDAAWREKEGALSTLEGALVEEAAGAQEAQEEGLGSSINDFTRFYEDPERGVVELQTAIVSYWKPGPWWDVLRPEVQVDLVSVVHIGDKRYYEGLQEELRTYDRVLYEMVSDKKSTSSSTQSLASDSAASSPWGPLKLAAQRLRDALEQQGGWGVKAMAGGRKEAGASAGSDAESDGEDAVEGVEGRRRHGSIAGNAWRSLGKKEKKGKKGKKRKGSLISFVQQFLAQTLRLSFQLDHIDYRSPNFLNADLDYDTFIQLQKQKGENIFSLAREVSVRSTKAVISAVNGPFMPRPDETNPLRRLALWAGRSVPMPLVGLLLINTVCHPRGAKQDLTTQPAIKALLNLDVATALKVVLAQQMSLDTLDSAASVMENSVIVGERNKAAMAELHQALDDGCRRVAVFYGSAHLPDMHRRICRELGMRPVALQWRTAWSILGTPEYNSELYADIMGGTAPGAPSAARAATSGKLRGSMSQQSTEADPSFPSRWRLSKSQTLALLIMSVLLALDLWLWECVLEGAQESAVQAIVFVANFLDQGWSL